ncbi:hypothetical protein ACFWY9_36595 [Amycolatopsis sp. NPDC059027]
MTIDTAALTLVAETAANELGIVGDDGKASHFLNGAFATPRVGAAA